MPTETRYPGLIVLLGSGETLPSSGKVHEYVAQWLPEAPRIAILETPAGFEPNSAQVAQKISRFLKKRLQNYKPRTEVIAARKRGTPFSPDEHDVVAPILRANWTLLGPGSPTYGARQLRQSLAVEMIAARHRLGSVLFLSSSATLAFSAYTMPVYEIYKVGQDLHWQNGVDYFSRFGLPLVIIPHWNNKDGGQDLDTSRCYMGQARFNQLRTLLPPNQTILGIDEHTGIMIDLAANQCRVIGNGRIHIIHGDTAEVDAHTFQKGDTFTPDFLGQWHIPPVGDDINPAIWQEAMAVEAELVAEATNRPQPTPEVLALVDARSTARAKKEWAMADTIRDQIENLGWQVMDTPNGARLEPLVRILVPIGKIMKIHPPISVLAIVEPREASIRPFLHYLQSIQPIQLTILPNIPPDLSPYHVLITAQTAQFTDNYDRLAAFVQAGGGWLGLVNLAEASLPLLFGAQPCPIGPTTELRILFQDKNHPIATRLPDAFYINGRYHPLTLTHDRTETTLYADWRYEHGPMLVTRAVGDGQVACTTLQEYSHPLYQQILYRQIRQLAGHANHHDDRALNIGLLGYAPSVGQLHGQGVHVTPGLNLRAACDLSPARLAEATHHFPHLITYNDAAQLAADPDIDLVIIATPPSTHASLALQMMAADKHVICEKPLAITTTETTQMAQLAQEKQLHLSCHQNRRWDVDYLAIQQALQEGLIGDLFYTETFVGGFEHPCGYWHSHDAVSGGTTYDWGAHYLDWIVSLIPDRITTVIGTRQNRVWHDVTNADQERIQIRFSGGQEVEFIHSDIAAIRKPKWYLLGSEGAIVGYWQDVTHYEIDPLLYFRQHNIPATEMMPNLILQRRHPTSGQLIQQKLPFPPRQPYQFHRNLADHLLTGEPIIAPLAQSIRVVAILEAAARSAANNGSLEAVNV